MYIQIKDELINLLQVVQIYKAVSYTRNVLILFIINLDSIEIEYDNESDRDRDFDYIISKMKEYKIL